MPIPLLWLGAGIAAAYAGTQMARSQQKYDGFVEHFPGESQLAVKPVDGSIVCCGIYEVFQHTGIWVDGQIIELRGNGLIRAVSPERFLHDRSGNRIYVACNDELTPLASEPAIHRALGRVFSYTDYDVLSNNCHRFVNYCLTGRNEPITRFAELNERLSRHFAIAMHWQPADV